MARKRKRSYIEEGEYMAFSRAQIESQYQRQCVDEMLSALFKPNREEEDILAPPDDKTMDMIRAASIDVIERRIERATVELPYKRHLIIRDINGYIVLHIMQLHSIKAVLYTRDEALHVVRDNDKADG